jgi:periplasmic protein TonB
VPEPRVELAVVPLASAALDLPGTIESVSVSTFASLGPGSRGGAGTGDGTGIGDGDGPGLGPGSRGSTGGGQDTGGGLTPPTVVRNVEPLYTADAMRARVEGIVAVRAIVQPDGTVGNMEIIRSLDPEFGLDQAAMKAAGQWLFRPGLLGGQPVPVAVAVELSFNLR